jgi:hypothetical protein
MTLFGFGAARSSLPANHWLDLLISQGPQLLLQAMAFEIPLHGPIPHFSVVRHDDSPEMSWGQTS